MSTLDKNDLWKKVVYETQNGDDKARLVQRMGINVG